MPTALIVDDEAEANKLLAMLVRLRGYETQSAYDGAQALAKVHESVPDVVFLDLMLPDRDGYDICRELKALGKTEKVPVIIVTARLAADNRIESFAVGADDYVPKPYTPDQIFDALDQSHIWRDQLSLARVEGQVVLDGRDDGETLRRLAQLRSLVLARGVLKQDAAARIVRAIRAIWSSVDDWSRRSHREQVATLTYVLDSEGLTLSILDEGGWLKSMAEPAATAPDGPLSLAVFDEISVDRDAGCLRLVKRLASPSQSDARKETPP
jgi:CheY-like chemotaxis protein